MFSNFKNKMHLFTYKDKNKLLISSVNGSLSFTRIIVHHLVTEYLETEYEVTEEQTKTSKY